MSSGLKLWLLQRKVRKAARLLKRAAISEAEYGAVVVDAVARVADASLRRESGWHLITFAVEAHIALAPERNVGDALDTGYGPVERAVQWVAEAFPVSAMNTDVWNRPAFRFTWGTGADALLRQANRHLRWLNRRFEALDAWRGEQAQIAPNLHVDAWRWVLYLLGLLGAFLLGRGSAI